MSPRRAPFSPWQSFADLAMGLMAVFALVLIIMLWTQGEENTLLANQRNEMSTRADQLTQQKAVLQKEKETLEDEKIALEQQRSEFALEILKLLRQTHTIVEAQDGAEEWIRALFAEDSCPLELTPEGTLRRISPDGQTQADLYPPGQTHLNPEGANALQACRKSFLRLAFCLSPDSAPERSTDPVARKRAEKCEGLDITPKEREKIHQLRVGLEAIVLQGNTDRTSLPSSQVPSIHTPNGGRFLFPDTTRSFLQNAHLGAERARQALGHLLNMAINDDADANDAMQVLMARVRIESASFGRYQAGPQAWRTGSCNKDVEACDQARNLAFQVRWKKSELRAPYEEIQHKLCGMLRDEQSPLSGGITLLLQDPSLLKHLNVSPEDWSTLVGTGKVAPADLQRLLGCPEHSP